MAFRPLQDTQLSLSNLQDEMNHLFGRIWHAGVSTRPFDGQQWAPPVDLCDGDDHYTLYAEIPGVQGGEINLSCLGHTLTIRGEKSQPSGISEQAKRIHGERRFGTCCRTIDLPGDAVPDKITARCQDGVLEVVIPKSEASRAKSIKIGVNAD
jgi:HSP20 family protein